MWLLGVVWMFVGYQLVWHGEPEPGVNPVPLELLPISVRAGIWFASAAVAFVTAIWPPGRDRFGFMALVIPGALRALSYWWALGAGLVTGNEIGDYHRWDDALVWTAEVLFVVMLASWPEPADSPRLLRKERP